MRRAVSSISRYLNYPPPPCFCLFRQLSVLNNAGWEDTVLWSPYGNEGMGYNNFVCVESVKVRTGFACGFFPLFVDFS